MTRKIPRWLRVDQVQKMFKAAKNPRDLVAMMLMFYAGMRIGEVTKLRPDDIDFTDGTIFVRQGKGSKDRHVNTPKWLRERHLSLLPLKVRQRALEAVFQRNSLKCGINRKIGSFMRGGKEVPIYRFHFHCLRHSYATRLVEAKIPINQVQIMMGHENLATTSRYTNANPKDAIDNILEAGL